MAEAPPRFAGLPSRAAAEPDSAAFLGYAELLRDIVDRRLYPSASTDLDVPSNDALFDDALRVVMERMIGDRLAALAPAEFAAAYRAVAGDAALLRVLDGLAAAQHEQWERDLRLARVRQAAEVSGRLPLGEVAAGEAVEIGLFDPARPDLAAWRFRDNVETRPLHRVLVVRGLSTAGRVEVVRDTWTGALWSQGLQTPLCEPFRVVSMGVRPPSDPSSSPRPELDRRARLVLVVDEGPTLTPPQIVGYVRTLDGTLLLDG